MTALGAYFILGEPLSIRQVGGGILMAIGFGLFFVPVLSNDPYRAVLDPPVPAGSLSLEMDPDRKGEKEEGVGVR